MKERQKLDLAILNIESCPDTLMSNLYNFKEYDAFSAWKIRVTVIQTYSKTFSFDIFTWFDRARRALQNGVY